MTTELNHMMRDPNTANCRIYIGNIKEGTTPPEVSQLFSTCGQVLGVILNRGFGFLQFDNEQSATSAIQQEGGWAVGGRKLLVRAALKNPDKTKAAQDVELSGATVIPQDLNRTARGRPARNRGGGGRGGGPNGRSNPFNDGAIHMNGRDRSPILQNPGGLLDQDQRWGNQNQNNFQPNYGGDNNGAGRQIDNNPPNRFNPSHQGPMQQPAFHNNMPQQDQHQQPASQATFTGDRNDCEIIVVNKMLTQYAEAIEGRLKRMGLRVDLLFPNDDVPVGKVLGNIVGRGCMYAILVGPMNEQHRSITVNVLHGETTEHRNMPVDDALEMINEDFQQAMQNNRRPTTFSSRPNMPMAVDITPTSSYAAPPLNNRHSDAFQTLINLLADNRPITVLQYDRVIRYLQERRELQLKAEIGDDPPAAVANIPPTPVIDPEIELKKKIMDILNKPSITTSLPPTVVAKPTPAPAANETAAAPSGGSQPKLLADPKVQKALDSLLSGSLFNM